MGDDGVITEERRRVKGRGRGLASMRSPKDNETKGNYTFMRRVVRWC